MSINEFKPVAKGALFGSVLGGVAGFMIGGFPGAQAGAHFVGALGTKIGLYKTGEDLVGEAVRQAATNFNQIGEQAGRQFQDIGNRVGASLEEMVRNAGVALEKQFVRTGEEFINTAKKAAGLYCDAAISAQGVMWLLEGARYGNMYAKDICAYETEWPQCYALRAVSLGLITLTAMSGYSLYNKITKIRKEGLFNHDETRIVPYQPQFHRTRA